LTSKYEHLNTRTAVIGRQQVQWHELRLTVASTTLSLF